MTDKNKQICCIPGCTNPVSPCWTTVLIPSDTRKEIGYRETCFHHIGNGGNKAPVEYALDEAARRGKRVVCVPGHKGWYFEAWRDEENPRRINWRENMGDDPEGPRGPIRHWPEDTFPSWADLYGWIVTAT